MLKEKIKRETEKQYHNLFEITLLVHGHYPLIRTKNPYKRITDRLLRAQGEHIQLLFNKLLHSLTALYHTVRYQNKERDYESSREDVLTTVQLMKHLLNAQSMLSKTERRFYLQLTETFHGQRFTRKQVQEQLMESKVRAQHKLNKLYHANLLERTGHINRGYSYRMK